jgi:GTP1/Obg family GTP-binding protein
MIGVKLYRVSVTRETGEKSKKDSWENQKSAFVVADGIENATKKALDNFNDIDGVSDYYVNGVDVMASDDGEGAFLL